MAIPVAVIVFLTTLLIATQYGSADQPTKPTLIFASGVVNSSSSTYYKNTKAVLSELRQQGSVYPYNNATSGSGADKVYGQYYCGGDVSALLCSECIKEAADTLMRGEFSHSPSGTASYRECRLSYDHRSMNSIEDSGMLCTRSIANVTDPKSFSALVGNTMSRLIQESAYGGKYLRFSTWEGRVSDFETVYCEMQCNPYLNDTSCESCLRSAYNTIHVDCGMLHSNSSQVLYPNCHLMYRVNATDFEKLSLASPPTTPISQSPRPTKAQYNLFTKGKSRNKQRAALFVALPVTVMLLLCAACLSVLYQMKRKQASEEEDSMAEIKNVEALQFNITTIRTATDHFSVASKLGEGGFGSVYKGMLPDGQQIAVKRLFQKSQAGVEEFKNEVIFVAKLQHRNLVKLIGYCLTGREKLLVFEFLPNLSLDNFLNDAYKREGLDWTIRYQIIFGVARGLLYLHEDSRLKVIHRDLKPNNILLDAAMNPKIADFGLAKSFNLDQSIANTHTIAGTYGYMSPEYAMHGQVSAKSDVYSFGVIVLEIVTGKRNIIQENQPGLFHHTWKMWTEGNALDIIDPSLMNNFSAEEAMACIHIGLLCIQEEPGLRPTMGKVVSVLNGNFTTLPKPLPPLIFTFDEDGSGIKYASTLIKPESLGHHTQNERYRSQ